jgi:biopolymer transport protein ExbD
MRLAKAKKSGSLAMNMTPMIDVVFLLLIFFMTVSQVSQINRLRLELPLQSGSEEQGQAALTINVSEDGQIYVGGDPSSIAGVVEFVSEKLATLNHDPLRLAVVIRADRRGASRTVNQVVVALSQLGIQRVRVAVESP